MTPEQNHAQEYLLTHGMSLSLVDTLVDYHRAATDECFRCGASLLPPTEPPHCEDCYASDDEEDR